MINIINKKPQNPKTPKPQNLEILKNIKLKFNKVLLLLMQFIYPVLKLKDHLKCNTLFPIVLIFQD